MGCAWSCDLWMVEPAEDSMTQRNNTLDLLIGRLRTDRQLTGLHIRKVYQPQSTLQPRYSPTISNFFRVSLAPHAPLPTDRCPTSSSRQRILGEHPWFMLRSSADISSNEAPRHCQHPRQSAPKADRDQNRPQGPREFPRGHLGSMPAEAAVGRQEAG